MLCMFFGVVSIFTKASSQMMSVLLGISLCIFASIFRAVSYRVKVGTVQELLIRDLSDPLPLPYHYPSQKMSHLGCAGASGMSPVCG